MSRFHLFAGEDLADVVLLRADIIRPESGSPSDGSSPETRKLSLRLTRGRFGIGPFRGIGMGGTDLILGRIGRRIGPVRLRK